MSTLAGVFRHLLRQGEAQPIQTVREETGAAFAHRAVALLAWHQGDTARMESEMLASAAKSARRSTRRIATRPVTPPSASGSTG